MKSNDLLCYKCHKINPNRVYVSFIDSADWIENKKTTNPMNKNDNKCFQNVVTLVLNHKEIGKDSERIPKIKPFIDKCNLEGINYPSEIDDWKEIKKSNLTIALHVLYAQNKQIYPAYISKHNSKCEKLVILVLIPNEKDDIVF